MVFRVSFQDLACNWLQIETKQILTQKHHEIFHHDDGESSTSITTAAAATGCISPPPPLLSLFPPLLEQRRSHHSSSSPSLLPPLLSNVLPKPQKLSDGTFGLNDKKRKKLILWVGAYSLVVNSTISNPRGVSSNPSFSIL